jgi:hypothetical protein
MRRRFLAREIPVSRFAGLHLLAGDLGPRAEAAALRARMSHHNGVGDEFG